MAFNIIAESSKTLDYVKLHKAIFRDGLPFDLIPMPGFGIRGGDAIGICVPGKNASQNTWRQLRPILKQLKSKFGCAVHDLYGGEKLGLFNISSFRKNLLGE